MANKRNEDIELGPVEGRGSTDKDPFLARRSSQQPTRPQAAGPFGGYFDKIDHSPGASILAYCLSSISMTVVNKYVVSGSEWNLNFFYLAVQVRPPNKHPHPRGSSRLQERDEMEGKENANNASIMTVSGLYRRYPDLQAIGHVPEPRSFRLYQGKEM